MYMFQKELGSCVLKVVPTKSVSADMSVDARSILG